MTSTFKNKVNFKMCMIPKETVPFTHLGAPRGCCVYNSRLESLNKSKNYYLGGYSISWKHFDDLKKEILEELTICPEYESAALNFYNETISSKNLSLDSVERVVIHVRRTDFISKQKHGYYATSVEFVTQAIEYVKQRTHPQKIPIFYVCADRIPWAKEELSKLNENMIFVDGRGDFGWKRDLAIMKNADIVILTAGASTFGWWGAYLNQKAHFILFNYPFVVKGSSLAGQTSMADMMMPSWIPLSTDSPMKK